MNINELERLLLKIGNVIEHTRDQTIDALWEIHDIVYNSISDIDPVKNPPSVLIGIENDIIGMDPTDSSYDSDIADFLENGQDYRNIVIKDHLINGQIYVKDGYYDIHYYYVPGKCCINIKDLTLTDEEKEVISSEYGGSWLKEIKQMEEQL